MPEVDLLWAIDLITLLAGAGVVNTLLPEVDGPLTHSPSWQVRA